MIVIREKGITITATMIREEIAAEITEIHIIEIIKAGTTTTVTRIASDRRTRQGMTETINNLTRGMVVDLTLAQRGFTIETPKEIIINLIRERREIMEWQGVEIANTTRKSIKIDKRVIRPRKDIMEDIILVIDLPTTTSTLEKPHIEINQIMNIKEISDLRKDSNLHNKIEIARTI